MKFLQTLVIIFIFNFAGFSQGIEFYKGDWKEALEIAKNEEKLIFVDAYAKWCGPCKRMAKTEFTKEEVGRFFNQNFINLKIDMEEKMGREFGQQYPVSAYPTMMFLDGDGKVVKKVKGGRSGDALIEMGTSALSSIDYTGKYESKYEAGDRDFDLVYNYLKALSKAGKPTLKVANLFLKEQEDKISREEKLKIVAIATTEADSKLFDTLVKDRSEIIKIVGEESYNNTVANACQKTIEKAIEYEYPSLVDEAISKMKEAKSPDAKTFAYTAKMDYDLAYKNDEAYIKNAKPYAKKYGKDNPIIFKEISDKVFKSMPDSEPAINFGLSLAKQLVKYSPKEESYVHYITLLMKIQRKEEALKIAKEGIVNLTKKDQKTASLKRVSKMIESRM